MTVRFGLTIERGTPRAFVPFEIMCPCGACTEPARGAGLFDSGAPNVVIPSSALPPHVRFDDLPQGGSVPISGVERRYAWWPAQTAVLGLLIADRVKVYETPTAGAWADFPILGFVDVTTRFRVTFDVGAGGAP
jgi:hypothetical protein